MSGFFGKKQVLLATLIVALGVAVYLNYYFSAQQPAVDTGAGVSVSSRDNLGDAQFVGGSAMSSQPTDGNEESDYFSQARENRETAREQALELIKEMMNDVKATDEIKKEALAKTEEVADAIEQESKIESLIKAKGFEDCVVYIEEDNCNVVVKADSLQPQQTIQITEIVTAQSNIVAQNIKISNVNS